MLSKGKQSKSLYSSVCCLWLCELCELCELCATRCRIFCWGLVIVAGGMVEPSLQPFAQPTLTVIQPTHSLTPCSMPHSPTNSKHKFPPPPGVAGRPARSAACRELAERPSCSATAASHVGGCDHSLGMSQNKGTLTPQNCDIKVGSSCWCPLKTKLIRHMYYIYIYVYTYISASFSILSAMCFPPRSLLQSFQT